MRSRQSTDALESSDVEITRVDNEPPHMAPPPWHVHLELRPEQLLALHRMGFTGGALAWREGMDDWQPLRVGGEPGDPPDEPSTSAPLARVTPLASARRRSHRDSSNPKAPAQPPARVTPFAHARAGVPPIINALPMPLVRVRRPADPAPPPTGLEGRIPPAPLPSFAADAMAALPGPPLELSPRVAPLEPKPQSIPPMALEPRANATRAGTSRAVMFGAVALVALSASNGALVSALLWKLRHEPALSAPSASPAAETRPPAPPLEAAPVANSSPNLGSTPPAPDQPLSVDQLPLAGATRTSNDGSGSSSSDATATPSTRATSSATRSSSSSRRSGRRSPATVVLDEEKTSRARKTSKEVSAQESGPPDRRAISRAIGHAAGTASSCAPGPETGRVSVTFAPSGNVQSVSLLLGFGEAGINTCVMRAMGRAKVRPFSGTAITVQKTLKW